MSEKTSRRDFIGMSFVGVTAVGAIFSLGAMKKSWDPLPSVLAGGFTTFDIDKVVKVAGTPVTVVWRGKPIFVLLKTSKMPKTNRDLVIGAKRYTLVIGICTHLGCIPAWEPKREIWKCACHGGEYNSSGKNIFGPPPRPLDLVPFSRKGTVLVLGETGPEYKKMLKVKL